MYRDLLEGCQRSAEDSVAVSILLLGRREMRAILDPSPGPQENRLTGEEDRLG